MRRQLTVLLTLLLATAACTTPSADDVDRPGHVGVAPGAPLLWSSDGQLEADMSAVARSGARWVRLDFDWASIEDVRGTYNWAPTSRVVDAARNNGLQVLGLLAYTPVWARPPGSSSHAPPLRDSDFARFAADAVERYRDTVDAWEVWNEPNLADFWEPAPDPQAYARLLKATSSSLRARDPDAVILSAGLAPARNDERSTPPEEFLAAVYEAGAGDAFDAVGVHPYTFPALPSDQLTGGWNTFVRLPLVRDVMLDNGDENKLIWITEFGSPTGAGDDAVTDAQQARILADGFEQARQWPWVGALFVYSLRDSGRDQADREQNFGLLRADGTPKSGWQTFLDEATKPWTQS